VNTEGDWISGAIPRSSYAFYKHKKLAPQLVGLIEIRLVRMDMQLKMDAALRSRVEDTYFRNDRHLVHLLSASEEGLATEGTIRREEMGESRRTGS
jgi:hypothetical protein